MSTGVVSGAGQAPNPNNNGNNGGNAGGNAGGEGPPRCPRCNNRWHGDSACWPRCQQCNIVHRPNGPCPQAAAPVGARGGARGGSSGSGSPFPQQVFLGRHIHFYNTPGMVGIGGMGGMGGMGGHAGAGTAVASAGRGHGPAGNNNRVGKPRHGPGRYQRMRNSAYEAGAEDMIQRLIAGGFMRRDEAGNLLPIHAPAAPGANATGDNLGGGVANTGANNLATGATGGNLASGALLGSGGNLASGALPGSGGNNPASGIAGDAGGNASGEMMDVETTGPIIDEHPVPIRRDEGAPAAAPSKPSGPYRPPHWNGPEDPTGS